jgi:CDP-glucose 4,6-dehydratase
LNSFFQNKKILITGHTGFKGCWLALCLQSLGANVKGFSLNPLEISLFKLIKMNTLMKGLYGDINNYSLVETMLHDFSPEIIFHLAAQPIVSESYRKPVKTYSTNIMGTVHLLEAVRKVDSVRVIINITTDKCYENKEWPWKYRESDTLGGKDPYSSSKACSELISAAYYHSYFKGSGVKLGTARSGNVIGGGDFARDRLIPDFIRAIKNDTSLTLRCPSAVRPWQYILDCIYGYLLFASYLWEQECDDIETYNFAPDMSASITVNDILDSMSLYLKLNKEIIIGKVENFKENSYLTLDNSKAKKELNWYSAVDTPEAIQHTAQWYKIYLENETDASSLLSITQKQIDSYLKLKDLK